MGVVGSADGARFAEGEVGGAAGGGAAAPECLA